MYKVVFAWAVVALIATARADGENCPDVHQIKNGNGVCVCKEGFSPVNGNTACTLRSEIFTVAASSDPADKAVVLQAGNVTLRTYDMATKSVKDINLLRTLEDLSLGHGEHGSTLDQLMEDLATKADASDVNDRFNNMNATLQGAVNDLTTLQSTSTTQGNTLQTAVQTLADLTDATTNTDNTDSLAAKLTALNDQVQNDVAAQVDLDAISAVVDSLEAESDNFITKSNLHRFLPGTIQVTNSTGPCDESALGIVRGNNQTQQYETCRRADTWDGTVYFWHPRGLPEFCVSGDALQGTCTQCIEGYVATQAPKAPCQIQADLLHLAFDNNLWDLSPNARNMLFYGTTPETLFSRTGLDGSPALSLRGSDQHLRAPPSSIGGAFSVCVDVSYDAFGFYSRIFDWSSNPEGERNGGNNNFLMLNRESSATFLFEIYSGPNVVSQLDYDNFFELGVWAHVCVTANAAGHFTLYKNGVNLKSIDATPLPYLRRTSNYIGRSSFANDPDFDGAMDNLRMWSRELTSEQVSDIFLESQGVQRVAYSGDTDALLLHYKFEGNLQDSSAFGNDGVALNHHAVNLYQLNSPEGNSSLYLDGDNDYVLAPPLTFNNALTVCAWVRYRELNAWSRVADFNNGGPDSIFIGNPGQSSDLEFTFLDNVNGNSPLAVAGGFNWAYGGFQHYCFTNEGAVSIVYRQGQEVGRKTNVNARAENKEYHNIFIGRSAWGADGYLGANLDDYRVYNYALSPEAVHDMLCQGRADLDCVGLAGHWKFDGDVRDASGNEWHGELVPLSFDVKDHFLETTDVAIGSGALALVGNGSWVQLPARNFGGDFTVCTWVQTRSNGPWERFADFGVADNSQRFFIGRSFGDQAIRFSIKNGETAAFVIADLPEGKANEFVHMCAMSNSTGGYIFFDGEMAGSNVGMVQLPFIWADVNYIGKSAVSNNDAPLDAVLDDMRVYTYALSQGEIAQLAGMTSA
ncbi:uncharacterized protein MONBRDRAFT_32635 [Monosiga brevicollis MX1]|uniref:LamG-like jellyroll fold domain-containing protein n=1 Tax=Monosiga brevicollis TaxID=81824 RepID=A9V0U4_MONBE|nr:uncharacterized protein MONBRDRAFT_32635 [Monosiga brevicollis MX1]EDQ88696.1 predicted protein [Monosiga brevicollis MX1]|eukprot:XP_001746309.1 hypothetical protein [Monosiga brevicollis MX1]